MSHNNLLGIDQIHLLRQTTEVALTPKLKLRLAFLACVLSLILTSAFIIKLFLWKSEEKPVLTKSLLAANVGEQISNNIYPLTIDVNVGSNEVPQIVKGDVEYTLDIESQEKMTQLLKSYKPDFAAFVAIDAQTGKILTINSYQKDPLDDNLGNISLRSIFPAASIFKVVTAAAAIDDNKLKPDSIFAFNGSSHTLYKRNVAETKINRWTRYMSLREAFAKSINTVFGKVGAFYVGPQSLSQYAQRFQFDRAIASDLPIEEGESFKPTEGNQYELAEAASGFNKESKMSPLQGAMIASAVINEGVIMEPYIVESVTVPGQSNPLYIGESKPLAIAIKPETAQYMRQLMNETVTAGTSRKSFRSIFRRKELFDSLDMGGKTGSLTANEPRAKVDWFVGYASFEGKKIAVAALTAHKKYWTVKSSYLAASYFDHYFRDAYREKLPERKKKIMRIKKSKSRKRSLS